MVPRVAAKGKSFKGAGLYYLHDKKASTAERVAFTLTENLPTDDPEMALRFMAYTAMRQDQLKAANDGARTGRKLQKPVFTYSLSWAPDEKPTQAEMIEAGRETLKVLGLQAHEVLMVAHNDEPHPHLHLIVNRVHPENGKAAVLSKDFLALSEWAEEYERRQGQIRCEERVANNNERRKRKFVKDNKTESSAEYRRWKKLGKGWDEHSALTFEPNIAGKHKAQRQALFARKEQRIAERRLALRGEFKPLWANLYKIQELEAYELHRAQKNAFSRLIHWVRHRDEVPAPKSGVRGWLRGALDAVLGRHEYAETLWKKQELRRKELADHIGRRTRDAIAEEKASWQRDLEYLKDVQRAELEALRVDPREEEFRREEAARRKPEAPTKPVKDVFRDRVAKRIRKARKKRDERGKGEGRERE